MARRPRRTASVALVLLCSLEACSSKERVVFRERSAYQEVIVSETPSGVRTLRFGEGGVIQSRVMVGEPETLLVPYVRAAMIGLGFVEQPSQILVVGLGGGSIPRFLHRRMPTAEIDAVDVDSVVVQVAREWFGVEEDERLKLIVGDGRSFIERAEKKYDLIFLDAFGEANIPAALTTREFLVAVEDALGPDGVVVANVWSGRSNPLFEEMVATYQHVFGKAWVFAVPERSNRIVVAPATIESQTELAVRVQALARDLGPELQLAELLERAELVREASGAAVLSD